MIARRDFVCAVVCTLLGSPLGVAAQQAPRVYRIGFLAFGSEALAAPFLKAFEEGLREFGYVNGRNITIVHRFAEGKTERLPALAAELVGFPVDVVMLGPALAYFSESPAVAAGRLTKTIPIVMFHADPVGSGLVASLARPGGNVTGLSLFNPAIVGKQLAVINEVLPGAGLVAVLRNPTNSAHVRSLSEVEVAARSVQIQLQEFAAQKPDEFEPAFAAMARGRARAVLVLGDSMFFLHRARIAESAKRQRLATMFVQREHAEAGGLMAYGANIADIYRRAATYVYKILKGAKPADLPVEQPTKFDFVINLKTANALGLRLPRSILARADEVIQ